MSSLVISGDTSGSVTLQAPAVSGSTVLTLPATSGTVITTASGTASSATTATTATNLAGGSNGTIPYQSASGTTQMLAVGTSGQVLQTNGAAAPSWVTLTSGLTLATPVNTTSGTSITFTGIPAGVKLIIVSFKQVNISGSADKLIVQLGDAGGIETSGYDGIGLRFLGISFTSADYTTGFSVSESVTSGVYVSGSMFLALENSSTFSWTSSSNIFQGNPSEARMSAGWKSLSQELSQLRITTVVGTATFVSGEINISYM